MPGCELSVKLFMQVKNLEMVGAPEPAQLMQASVKQALRRLDKVDPEVKAFFLPSAAKTVAAGADPIDALAAALGCLSGLTEVPKDRSLLTQVACSMTKASVIQCSLVTAMRSLHKPYFSATPPTPLIAPM